MHYIALGFALVLVCLALGQETGEPQNRPAENQQDPTAKPDSQATDQPTVIAPSASAPIAPAEPGGEIRDGGNQQTEEPNSSQPPRAAKNFRSWWKTFVSSRDTLAQWIMALFGALATGISIWAVILLRSTLSATRDTAEAARTQADAAILLEAAKIVVSRARFFPVGGGVGQTEGMPINGLTPVITLKNIGNTRAFILRTCIVLIVSPDPPKRVFPKSKQLSWPARAGVQADTYFDIRDNTETVSLSEQQQEEIRSGKTYIWLLAGIWFKDWFGIKRQEDFLFQWKGFRLPGEHPSERFGFIRYDRAE